MNEYTSTGIDILKAAKKLFSNHGYQGVSTKKIAAEAKANEVTLFRIFGSKEKLFAATFEYFFFKPNFTQFANSNEQDLEQVLTSIGKSLHEFFVSNLSLIKIEIQSQNEIYKKQSLNRFPKEIRDYLTGQFQKHKSLGLQESKLQAICFLTGLHGLCLNLYLFQTLVEDIDFDKYLATLVSNYK